MKTKSTISELLMFAPLLIAALYVSIIWQQIPARMASHFDLTGNADGWANKSTVAWEGIGLTVFMYVLLRFLPAISLKGRLQSANYHKLRFIIMLLIPVPLVGVFYMATHPTDSQAFLSPLLALVSLLMAGIGNYMTNIKPNWFVGIRTPWTLMSETVWRKTHHMGGRLLFAGGLLAAVLALVVPMPYTVAVVMGVILTATIIPVVYSYIYFRQEKTHQLS